ncbi:MAG: DUF389 domain-containing protein [Anaerolineales bacterium]|jgi:uncharacterized hydrophobic protein (TIGR00271 family)
MNQQVPNHEPEEFGEVLLYYLGRLRVRIKFYLRKMLPPVTKERLAEVQISLRDTSKPDFDYFVLVLLSCMIATFGLLIDSAATIIGAMLVAPLMSPILGIGLASIRGDTGLLKDASAAIARGALLAVLLSTFIAWSNNVLPFVTLQDLPDEVLSRTRPSPIDLGVALAGGLAATFALVQPQLSAALPGVAIATALMPPLCTIGVGISLGRWDVAGGALLLFITNAVTIASSSIFLFYVMGFNLGRKEGDRLLPRSLQISAVLIVILLIPLVWQSYVFVQDANLNRTINEVVKEEVANVGATLDEVNWRKAGDILQMNITVLVSQPLYYSASVELQDAIAARLQKTVELKVNQVTVAKLDPLVPPTHTPTATIGPSPTYTDTPTPSITPSPSQEIIPTDTPTLTPTPALALLYKVYGDGVSIRAFPEGPAIGWLRQGDQVRVLYGYEIVNGWVWIEVQDVEGRIGWLPQYLTRLITETPTRTPKVTTSPSPTPMVEGNPTTTQTLEETLSSTLTPELTPSHTLTPEMTPSPTP